MNPEHERKLWRLRFQRVLELEEESFHFYKRLLQEKAGMLEAAGMAASLSRKS